jgi:hypothetical protein
MDFNNFEQNFKRAQKDTVIHRERKSSLYTFGSTTLPYIFLAKSAINQEDTVKRSGEIKTDKPVIFTGENLPNFSGFGEEYDENEKEMRIIMGRQFKFPGLNYHHAGSKLEVISKSIERVTDEYQNDLEKESNFRTALIAGPEDCWALSVLIYAAEMTQKSASSNLNDIMERKRLNSSGGPDLLDDFTGF